MQPTERILREMIAEAEAAKEAQASREKLMEGLFSDTGWPQPPPAQFPRVAKRDTRSDFVIAALGVTLGLICALFPWYIFYNQEKFGVQAVRLGGSGSGPGRTVAGEVTMAERQPLTPDDLPILNLDPIATGTLADQPVDEAGIDQQPFPAQASEYHLVYISNGRAMIEDDSGIWVVQRGSTLPDASRVAAIERRGDKWVVVTSDNRILEIGK